MLPEVAGSTQCQACGCEVPAPDLFYTGSGGVCLVCHGEREAERIAAGSRREVWSTLAGVAALVPLAWLLSLARGLDLGPAGVIGWMVMNIVPACGGAALVVLSLRHLRDAWVNPLGAELDGWATFERGAVGLLAVVGSIAVTAVLVWGALSPFLG